MGGIDLPAGIKGTDCGTSAHEFILREMKLISCNGRGKTSTIIIVRHGLCSVANRGGLLSLAVSGECHGD